MRHEIVDEFVINKKAQIPITTDKIKATVSKF